VRSSRSRSTCESENQYVVERSQRRDSAPLSSEEPLPVRPPHLPLPPRLRDSQIPPPRSSTPLSRVLSPSHYPFAFSASPSLSPSLLLSWPFLPHCFPPSPPDPALPPLPSLAPDQSPLVQFRSAPRASRERRVPLLDVRGGFERRKGREKGLARGRRGEWRGGGERVRLSREGEVVLEGRGEVG
jgi:hypothetical protein